MELTANLKRYRIQRSRKRAASANNGEVEWLWGACGKSNYVRNRGCCSCGPKSPSSAALLWPGHLMDATLEWRPLNQLFACSGTDSADAGRSQCKYHGCRWSASGSSGACAAGAVASALPPSRSSSAAAAAAKAPDGLWTGPIPSVALVLDAHRAPRRSSMLPISKTLLRSGPVSSSRTSTQFWFISLRHVRGWRDQIPWVKQLELVSIVFIVCLQKCFLLLCGTPCHSPLELNSPWVLHGSLILVSSGSRIMSCMLP